MPERPGSAPGELPGLPASRTWRLPVRYRITLAVIQAVIPAFAALAATEPYAWGPHGHGHYLPAPAGWLIMAAGGAAWIALARRAWRESLTLTPDLLVVRSVFRTRTVPLAEVTGVSFRGWASMIVSASRRPLPNHGRHSGGRRVVVPAVKLGAAWATGRRSAADEAMDAVAAAAGLRARAPRKEVVSRRAAWIMLPSGVACYLLAAVVGGSYQSGGSLLPSARFFLGRVLMVPAMMLVFPAFMAILDRSFGRWRRDRTGTPGVP